MNPQKKSSLPSFKSLRIIGKKAHELLKRAQAKARQEETGRKNGGSGLPETEEHPTILVHLSIRSIVQATFAILAIGVGALLLFYLKDKLVLLFLAIFVATIMDPGVRALQKWKVPRSISILLHYIIALALFVFLLVSLIPVIASQIQQIAVFTSERANSFLAEPNIALPFLSSEVNLRLTVFLKNTLQNLSITHFTDALQQFSRSLSTTAQGSLLFAAQIAGSVVDFFVNLVLILVMAFFMQLEKERIITWLRGFIPRSYNSYMQDKSDAIQWKLAQWVRGQLILCFSIGFLVFLALSILRVPYALTLGILAGFTEFIPVVGPLIAAVPAVLIALTGQGFLWAVVIAVTYYIIQWCENNLLVPLIMKRAVGLSPIAILFAMLAGISFPWIIHPVLGVILAIPVTTIFALFLEDFRTRNALRSAKKPAA